VAERPLPPLLVWRRCVGMRSFRVLAGCCGLVLTLAACTADPQPAAAPTSQAAVANPIQVECLNVERAYLAWSQAQALPHDAAGVLALAEAELQMLKDDADTFANDVEIYEDPPSMVLAAAVGRYNADLAITIFTSGIMGKIDADRAAAVAMSISEIHSMFRAFMTSNCA